LCVLGIKPKTHNALTCLTLSFRRANALIRIQHTNILQNIGML
jgi:hypothetical protein